MDQLVPLQTATPPPMAMVASATAEDAEQADTVTHTWSVWWQQRKQADNTHGPKTQKQWIEQHQ